MSSHVLDVSGARPLTTTTNDPASTRIFMPSKPGDDVAVTLSGFRELRFEIPDTARVQRRRYVKNEVVYENGKPKPNPDPDANTSLHPYETQEVEYERTVLVLQSVAGFGRSSFTAEEKLAALAEERTVYEQHPHTQIVAKREPEPHLLEAGVLVSEQTVGEAIAAGLFPGLGVVGETEG